MIKTDKILKLRFKLIENRRSFFYKCLKQDSSFILELS